MCAAIAAMKQGVTPMSADNLREALVEEIRDLYNAEKHELRDAFESHLEETEGQVARLERVFELLDEKPRGKHCAGMAGIIEEGSDVLNEDMEDSVKDACLIAGGQRAEHYEIAAYGTAIAWSKALGLTEVAQVLDETLAEEKAADEKLTALAESGINEAATAGESSDDMEEDDDQDAKPSRGAEPAAMSAKGASGSAGTNGKTARQRGGRR
jgi:ferritin-like metal-binding protein YciE